MLPATTCTWNVHATPWSLPALSQKSEGAKDLFCACGCHHPLAAVLGTKPHTVHPIEVKVEAVLQRHGAGAKALPERVRLSRKVPHPSCVMAPAVVDLTLFRSPALRVVICVRQLQDEAHTARRVGHVPHLASVEDDCVVGRRILLVVWNVG